MDLSENSCLLGFILYFLSRVLYGFVPGFLLQSLPVFHSDFFWNRHKFFWRDSSRNSSCDSFRGSPRYSSQWVPRDSRRDSPRILSGILLEGSTRDCLIDFSRDSLKISSGNYIVISRGFPSMIGSEIPRETASEIHPGIYSLITLGIISGIFAGFFLRDSFNDLPRYYFRNCLEIIPGCLSRIYPGISP